MRFENVKRLLYGLGNGLKTVSSSLRRESDRGHFSQTTNTKSPPYYERLEGRRLLAGVSWNAGTGEVFVEGTLGNDTMLVSEAMGGTQFSVVFNSGAPLLFNYSTFDRVIANGLGGDDNFENQASVSSTMNGGNGADTLKGGSGVDLLYGNEGDDNLNGGGGNDTLEGGLGNDVMDGWSGDDTVNGNGGNDTLYGGGGHDTINGNDGMDTISGWTGNDVINGGADDDTISGGEGNDWIDGWSGDDTVNGDGGNDILYGGGGHDTINGNGGVDTISGWTGNDVINGGAGNDTISGGDGDDWIDGWSGDDAINGDDGNDALFGGGGHDTINGNKGADTISGWTGNDTINGGADDDTISGGEGADFIDGWSGDDVINGGDGNDNISGGGGDDTIHGDAGDDSVRGWIGIDYVYGDDGADTVRGDDGNDFLYGGDGNDRFEGNGGNDSMYGGTGNDVYVFASAISVENDTIIELSNQGIDTLDFRAIATAVTADLQSSANIVSTHLNRNVLVQSPGDGVHLENAFGLAGSDIWSFKGEGQITAVIDSGIAYDHEDLGGGLGTGFKVVGGFDFAENDSDPYDDGPAGWHGTHVAGIVANTDPIETGVAPDAELVALRVFDDNGSGGTGLVRLRDALTWVINNLNSFANPITTINLSLGVPGNANAFASTDPVTIEVNNLLGDLEDAGVFISVAAGNGFANPLFNNQPGLAFPAISPNVVPVASHGNDANADTLSDSSQRRFNVLVAPGENIRSTVPDHLLGGQQTNQFLGASGTSQAAPFVAGASMLLREAFVTVGVAEAAITQDMLYATFQNFADAINDPITNANYDKINLEAALAGVLVDGFMPAAQQSSVSQQSSPAVSTGNVVLFDLTPVLNTAKDSARINPCVDSTATVCFTDNRETFAREQLANLQRQTPSIPLAIELDEVKMVDAAIEENQFPIDELSEGKLLDFSFEFETDFSFA